MAEQLTLLITMPILFYAIFISQLYFQKLVLSTSSAMPYSAMGLGTTAYFTIKIARLLNNRRTTRLGYDGELAVGQELNRMMQYGYHVYHDFVADAFNIDHIVIGPSGVFAVETKARAKPTSK